MTIYRLMVIALSAELQNVLHNISYGKLEDALKDIKTITQKYYDIATDGNQSIASTVKKFIGEIDYYFQEAVKIEYEYYVQKERAREEQRAIRDQMRQEAEERRELERQRKQIEKEESKYHDQIGQLSEQLAQSEDDEKTRLLKARIEELQRQLTSVAEQREKIVQLQNGKAGNVYVISNIGSFGENVFKIGMTRRLEPMDRVNELGNASVPFPFDVHSLIFSDDAVGLETKLHHILNDQRVNKVNLRKEFFRVSLDDIEKLVAEVAPTAEFKRTALAESLIGAGFPFRKNDNVEAFMKVFGELAKTTSGIRRAGAASLDLAYVAAGRLDAFWEPNLKAWDIAAGALLVLEAGGLVTDFKGESDYLTTGQIVAGTPKVFGQLLPVVNKNYGDIR